MLTFLSKLTLKLKEEYPEAMIYLTGGAVREMLLFSFSPSNKNDYDCEVFGVYPQQFIDFLNSKNYGKLKLVDAKSFGILDLVVKEGKVQFSFPRRERKTGEKHTSFDIDIDAFMSIKEAQSRRNYTINSVYYDFLEDKFIDYFGGRSDADLSLLSATSYRFIEDPLRVLIGVQLASRYCLYMDDKTTSICKSIKDKYNTVSPGRVWLEWEKWGKGRYPHLGLLILQRTEWIENTPLVVDGNKLSCFEKHSYDTSYFDLGENELVLVNLAILLDVDNCDKFFDSVKAPNEIRKKVSYLVNEKHWIKKSELTAISLRYLLARLRKNDIHPRILGRVFNSTFPGSRSSYYNEVYKDIDVTPIISGKHLVDLGVKEGPIYGKILDKLYRLQLDGRFYDEKVGIKFLEEIINDRE